jgi:sugar transferase (PEP-CTERM/EpsH1 system associated)
MISLGRAPDSPAFLLPQFTRLFLRERPDIVHSRNWATIEAIFAARLAHVGAVVHSEHGRDLRTIGPQPWRRRFFRRFSYARATRVFCVSEELREYYSRQLGLKSTFLDVIPNGVDVAQFCPNAQARVEKRARLGARANSIVVGTVGRLDPIKDHATLVSATGMALDQNADLRLVIVGGGEQRIALERLLVGNPDLARLTTLVGEAQDVADWLNAFDIFVLPSLSEGMSNTLLEAMAVGVAPIATEVGGNPEIVEPGHSGMLARPGDAQGLCRFIVQLASSYELRCEMGRNARARVVKRFSLERMLKRYEAMYCELVRPKTVPVPTPARA